MQIEGKTQKIFFGLLVSVRLVKTRSSLPEYFSCTILPFDCLAGDTNTFQIPISKEWRLHSTIQEENLNTMNLLRKKTKTEQQKAESVDSIPCVKIVCEKGKPTKCYFAHACEFVKSRNGGIGMRRKRDSESGKILGHWSDFVERLFYVFYERTVLRCHDETTFHQAIKLGRTPQEYCRFLGKHAMNRQGSLRARLHTMAQQNIVSLSMLQFGTFPKKKPTESRSKYGHRKGKKRSK